LVYEGLLSDELATAVTARRAIYGEPAPVALAAVQALHRSVVAGLFERLGYVSASKLRPSPHIRALPRGMARALWVLPIGESPEGVVVAMVDPTDAHALRELRFHLRRPIDPRCADMDALRAVLFEVDPPTDVRGNTRPAPGAVPPAIEAREQWSSGDATLFAREAVGMVSARERSVTPPYGQPVASGATSAWGRGPSDVVRLDTAAISLGSKPPRSSLSTPTRGVDRAIPLRPPSRRRSAVDLPREALQPLAEMKTAEDYDAIARACVRALALVGERAVFFVVKKGVVQGWDGASVGSAIAGLSREALQNLWIPITARSIFREATSQQGVFSGPLSDSSADTIISAAIGGRPAHVIVASVEVRGRVVAFLYVDNPEHVDNARYRVTELTTAAAAAIERLLLTSRG
jgi:hypothetical protein